MAAGSSAAGTGESSIASAGFSSVALGTSSVAAGADSSTAGSSFEVGALALSSEVIPGASLSSITFASGSSSAEGNAPGISCTSAFSFAGSSFDSVSTVSVCWASLTGGDST